MKQIQPSPIIWHIKKGRPSTTLNKLVVVRNSIHNDDIITKRDDLIQRLESNRNTYTDTKRGIECLKSNEDTCHNSDDYIKKKHFDVVR